MSTPALKRILQVGMGGFGREHLAIWRRLAAEGAISIAGVVVATESSQVALQGELGVPVFRGIAEAPLDAVDAVDIVTPSATHADLVRHCIRRTDVLVEKPLATNANDAEALADLATTCGRILAVGHVFRFRPLVQRLREIVDGIAERPQVIFGAFVNPEAARRPGNDPSLEMLHWFDVLDLLFGATPDTVDTVAQGATHVVSLRYPGPTNAILKLGWEGTATTRRLELIWRDRSIQANLADNTIVVDDGRRMRKLVFPQASVALEAELRDFVSAIIGRRPPVVDGHTAARVVGIAARAHPRRIAGRPRVAVIGGGIFGATCAAELGTFCDVTLYERHAALCREASTLNQWRYHRGFHYPRSTEMIREIEACRHEFEAVYGHAIVPGLKSYYCTVPGAQVINRDRYLHTCRAMDLAFEEAMPLPHIIEPAHVDLCLRTGESVFDADVLRGIILDRLTASPSIRLAFNQEIVDATILHDGSKRLSARGFGGRKEDDAFDYVVNATYANRNLLARLLGFPLKPLRFDLLELLILEVPIPQMSITVLDGPFVSLVSMGRDRLFTLSHIQHSVLASDTPTDGIPPSWTEEVSNRENLLRDASYYMPVLREARYIESRYGTRAMHAIQEDVDGRPTVVVDHGFGCWSILGGKVNTSVTNARQIARQIAQQRGIATPEHDTNPSGRAATDDGDEWRDRLPTGARRR
jgi:predicted dehydrogenase